MTDAKQKFVELYNRWWIYKKYHDDWHNEAMEDLDFYMLKQWTADEIDELEARGQAPLVVDYIRPAILQLTAILSSRMPEFKVTGVTDDDVRVSSLFNMALQYVLYDNEFERVEMEWIKNTLILGAYYLYTYYDAVEDRIKIETVHSFDVFPDPESRKPDLSDADSIIIVRSVSRDRAKLLAPDMSDKIDNLTSDKTFHRQYIATDYDSDNTYLQLLDQVYNVDSKRILFFDSYKKISHPHFTYVDKETGDMVEFDEERAKKFESDEEVAKAIKSNNILKSESTTTRIEHTVYLGDEEILTEVLPISEYPIIPLFFEHQGNPYSIGAVRTVKGLQREVNKRRSLMIAHATASTNFKLLYLKGAIDDEDAIEEEWARPSAAIGINPVGGSMRISDMLMTPVPAPLPQALYALEQKAAYNIQYSIGLMGISMGDASQAPMTHKATLAIEEFGARRQGIYAREIAYAIRRLGKIVTRYVQEYFPAAKMARIANPQEGDMIPLVDEYGNELELYKKFSTYQYDIMVIPASITPSNRWATLEMYMDLYEKKLVDKLEVWKKSDIFDTKELEKRFGEIAQLQGVIAQLKEELQRAKSQVVREQQKRMTSEERTQIERMKNDIKAGEPQQMAVPQQQVQEPTVMGNAEQAVYEGL